MSIAVADVNGDGRSDIVQLNACDSGGNCSNGVVGVLLGNGDGTFQTALVFNAGPNPKAVAIADANGDGKADIVLIADSSAGTLLGNGDGAFQALQTSNLGMQPLSMVTADVNNDGRADLVMIDSAVAWVSLANADGTFQTAQSYDDASDVVVQVVAGDVNGDGNPDIIVLNQCSDPGVCGFGEFSVLLGNGDGTFRAPIIESTGSRLPNAMAIMDVNEDGRPDLVVLQCVRGLQACLTGGGGRQGPAKLTMFAGDGSGAFHFLAHLGAGDRGGIAIAVGDVTGDGRPDVVVQAGSFGVFVHTGRYPTMNALSSSANPSPAGQPVTFTATVSSNLPGLTGFVRFMNGKHCLGKIPLVDGVATLTTDQLPVGTLPIIALYEPDLLWEKSEGTLMQVVSPPSGRH